MENKNGRLFLNYIIYILEIFYLKFLQVLCISHTLKCVFLANNFFFSNEALDQMYDERR